jgi:ABC-type Fe3+-citrate transport system substrate-binding protein
MQRRWLTVLGVTGVLLVALLLTACGGDAEEKESAPVAEAKDEAGEALIGTTPGKPALVDFYATW